MKYSIVFCVVNLVNMLCFANGPSFTGLGVPTGTGLFSFGSGVSDNGTVIGSQSYSGSIINAEPFIWSASNGKSLLGVPSGYLTNQGLDIKSDGSVFIGATAQASLLNTIQAYEASTEELGLDRLDFVNPDDRVVGVTSISDDRIKAGGIIDYFYQNYSFYQLPDGTQVVDPNMSYCNVSKNGRYIVFRQQFTSNGFSIDDLTGDRDVSFVEDFIGIQIDNSGDLSVGYLIVNSEQKPAIWSRNFGVTSYSSISGNNRLEDVSATGNRAVGGSISGTALLWTSASGAKSLQTILQNSYQLTNLSGWTLTYARSICSNGRYITGEGVNSNGQREGWFVELPCPGDLDYNGQVDITDLATLLSNQGLSNTTWVTGDLDYNNTTNLTDLSILLTNYQSCY